jgi:hypothetical protein
MDEAHVGSTSESFIDRLKLVQNVPFVMLTATYSRPVRQFITSNQDLFLWDLTDIQWMRNLSSLSKTNFPLDQQDFMNRLHIWARDTSNTITKMYGVDNVVNIIASYVSILGIERLVAPYKKFPKPYWITPKFNETVSNQLFSAFTQDESKGFHLLEHFQVDGKIETLKNSDSLDTWFSTLVDKTKLLAIAKYITPSVLGDVEVESPVKDHETALNRIFRIAKRPSRGVPFSVLFFLDVDTTKSTDKMKFYGDIRQKSMIWASTLNKFSFWRDSFLFVLLPLLKWIFFICNFCIYCFFHFNINFFSLFFNRFEIFIHIFFITSPS